MQHELKLRFSNQHGRRGRQVGTARSQSEVARQARLSLFQRVLVPGLARLHCAVGSESQLHFERSSFAPGRTTEGQRAPWEGEAGLPVSWGAAGTWLSGATRGPWGHQCAPSAMRWSLHIPIKIVLAGGALSSAGLHVAGDKAKTRLPEEAFVDSKRGPGTVGKRWWLGGREHSPRAQGSGFWVRGAASDLGGHCRFRQGKGSELLGQATRCRTQGHWL